MTTNIKKQEQVDYSKLWWATLLAAGISAGVNVVIYTLAQSFGFVGEMVPSFLVISETSFPFALAIVASTFIFIIVGGLALWIIDRFNARPISTWRTVAIVALLLSFTQPFTAFSQMNEIILLILMHTIAGIITIYIITSQAKKA